MKTVIACPDDDRPQACILRTVVAVADVEPPHPARNTLQFFLGDHFHSAVRAAPGLEQLLAKIEGGDDRLRISTGGQDRRADEPRSPKDRAAFALAAGEKVFPGAYTKSFEQSFSLAWHRVKCNWGAWAEWTEKSRARDYPILVEGEGRTLLAGEPLSYLGGWQAGAIESAWQQIARIHQRLSAA